MDPLTQDIVEEFVKINGEKYNKVYKKVSMLGKGGFAECFLTQQKETNKRMATKIIPKKLLDSHRTKIRVIWNTNLAGKLNKAPQVSASLECG